MEFGLKLGLQGAQKLLSSLIKEVLQIEVFVQDFEGKILPQEGRVDPIQNRGEVEVVLTVSTFSFKELVVLGHHGTTKHSTNLIVFL